MIILDTRPLQRLSRRIGSWSRRIEESKKERLDKFGQELLDATRFHASGRPGPNIVTGNYYNSIRLEKATDYVYVTSSAPQARRLEYGFVGTDSLGRSYNQPPYPHFRPAIQEVAPRFRRSMSRLAKDSWKET